MNRRKNFFTRALPYPVASIGALFFLALCLSFTAQAQSQSGFAEEHYSDFSPAELDQILAPIALYPDTVLSHILIASTYPLEIIEADRWARANPGLSGEDAVAAVEHKNWDPSVQALVAFPQILRRMSEDLDWTQRLGDAFLGDETQVMGAIQNLRYKAHEAGTLERMEHVHIHRVEQAIVIEPAVERVVYVPVYDTRVVYGSWWWADYPPYYWHYPGVTYVSGFYWGPRIYVGPSFYFSTFHWQRRQVVYIDYRSYHRRPHFYSGRSIVYYHGHRQWRHNPEHRRGVAYRSERVRSHYGSNREPSRPVRRAESPNRRAPAVTESRRRHSSERVREQLSEPQRRTRHPREERDAHVSSGSRTLRQGETRQPRQGETRLERQADARLERQGNTRLERPANSRPERQADTRPERRPNNRGDVTPPQYTPPRDNPGVQRNVSERDNRRATPPTSPTVQSAPPRPEVREAPREETRMPARRARPTDSAPAAESVTTTPEAPPARTERRSSPTRESWQGRPQRNEASPRGRENRPPVERQPARRGHEGASRAERNLSR